MNVQSNFEGKLNEGWHLVELPIDNNNAPTPTTSRLSSLFQSVQTLAETFYKTHHRTEINASVIASSRPGENVQEFNELIRRVNREERKELLGRLDSIPQMDEKCQELLESIKKKERQIPIFKDINLPFYALGAFKRGMLSEQQFGSILLYWSVTQCQKENMIKVISLFHADGTINEEAKHIIFQTMQFQSEYCSPQVIQKMNDLEGMLDEEQLEKLFESFRNLPQSEQLFYTVPDLHGPNFEIPWKNIFGEVDVEEYMKSHTISQEILYSSGINAFSRYEQLPGTVDYYFSSIFNSDASKPKRMRMIPTIGMMQAFLNLRYGDNAVTIRPVLGLSSLMDIKRNGLNDTRDLGLRFPGVSLSDEADGFQAPHYEFTYHDFYHSIVASAIPSKHRKKMIEVSDLVLEVQKSLPKKEKKGCAIYKMRLRDMEHGRYRELTREGKQNGEIFWLSLRDQLTMQLLHPEYKTSQMSDEVIHRILEKIGKELKIGEDSLLDMELYFGLMRAKDISRTSRDPVSRKLQGFFQTLKLYYIPRYRDAHKNSKQPSSKFNTR